MTSHPSGAPLVGIVIGSDTDYPAMEQASRLLTEFGIACEMTIASAHRSPARVEAYARDAEARGLRVIIAGPVGRRISPACWQGSPSSR